MTVQAARQAAWKHRILVVDDDPDVRQLVLDVLDAHGYLAEGAEDGLQALARLQHGEYDAIVTDFQMPRLDGLALLREVRRMEHGPPILVQSGAWDASLETRLRQDGAFRVLMKGEPTGHLLGSVEEACRASRTVPARCP